MGKRIAQRAARHLWVVAEDAFQDMRVAGMMNTDPVANGRMVRERLEVWTATCLPLLAALDFNDDDLPSDMAKNAVSASLDGLADIYHRDQVGAPVPEPHRTMSQRYYTRLTKDETLARQHLGLPPAPRPAEDPTMSRVLAALDSLRQQGEATAQELRSLKASQDPKVGPLFSAAADSYHDEMARAHGVHHADLKSVLHRKAVFIAICGDRPVTTTRRRISRSSSTRSVS